MYAQAQDPILPGNHMGRVVQIDTLRFTLTFITLQALNTLSSSSAKLGSPTLCLMILSAVFNV